MGIGAGFCMNDIVVKKFTFAISSTDEFLLIRQSKLQATFTVKRFQTAEEQDTMIFCHQL